MSSEFFDKVGTNVSRGGPNGDTTKNEVGNGLRERLMPSFGEEAATDPVANDKPTASAAEVIKRWSYSNEDLFWAASPTIDVLEPGFYGITSTPSIGICLQKKQIATDDLMRLPDSASDTVIAEFDKFWSLKEKFRSRGFLHKRGIMLWGPPGSGKTASLMLMSHEIITKQGGVVVQLEHPGLAAAGLSLLRKIEPDRPVVALLEDLDALVNNYGENQFLALLDGETQIDGIVYIATTNYPEKLDRRFVDRPSRFDTVRFIGMPTAPARRIYLSTKEPTLTAAELTKWVDKTDGFSIAHLRELVILVQCFGETLDYAIDRLESMRIKLPNSGDAPDKVPFGFNAKKNSDMSATQSRFV